jgi:NhaP-type Na+/H+ and K+/H+ antiporter
VTAVRGWNEGTDAWLSKLRTWQFVLLWDGVIVGCMLLALIFFQWLWTSHFNLSTLLGSAVGVLLASSVFAFVARSQVQDRVKRNAGKPSTGSLGPAQDGVGDKH